MTGSDTNSGTTRIAVLASGGGSNLQALIDHFRDIAPDAGTVVWVGANRAEAGALTRARNAGIDAAVVANHEDGEALLAELRRARADLLVLAGYLKRVPPAVVDAFHGRLLNVHPALLPAFGGEGMYGVRVHTAVIAAGAAISGVTVHFVDADYDRGAIIAQWPVSVHDDDTPAALAARVLQVEHRLLPLCVESIARGALTLGTDGRVHGRAGALQPDFTAVLPSRL